MKPLDDTKAVHNRLVKIKEYLEFNLDSDDYYYRELCVSMIHEILILEKHIKRCEGLAMKKVVEIQTDVYVLNICNHPLQFKTDIDKVTTVWPSGFVLPKESRVDYSFKNKLHKFHTEHSEVNIVGSIVSAKYYSEVVVAEPANESKKGVPLKLPIFHPWSFDLQKKVSFQV